MKPFREKEFNTGFMELIEAGSHEKALGFLIEQMPRLLASGMNRKEKLNHLLYASQLVQSGGNTKHGSAKLIGKAKSVANALQRQELKQRDLFVDFGAGAHDPIALSTYFYLNGFDRALANDMLAPRNMTYSALSMREILSDMNARPEAFLLDGSDMDLFQKRLKEFDIAAFGQGKFYEGFAGTEGRVRYVVDDIVNAEIEPGSISLFVSFAVFEHVDDMEGVLNFFHKCCAPGGIGFHYIDLADHRSYRHDGEFNAFSFLTEKEGPVNINRLRKSEQENAFTKAGFTITNSVGTTKEIPEATRAKFLPKWEKMSEEDKTTFGMSMIVEKSGTAGSKIKTPTKKTGSASKIKSKKKPAPAAVKKKLAQNPSKKEVAKKPRTSHMRMNQLGFLEEYRVSMPEGLATHPSMMSPVEREVLYGLASKYYTGKGRIVDAGVFLGASTRIFGKGIRANTEKTKILKKYKKPCVTFEHGQLGGGMPKFFERHGVDTSLIEGTSFAPLLKKMIKDVRPLVDLRIGDILSETWGDEPIEILFLDVVKSYDINAFTLKNFFPRLIPGRSILIQQDYFIDRLPFLKMSQESLAPYFEYIGNAQSSGYFLLKKKIPKKVLAKAANPNGFEFDEKISLIEQCAERVSFDSDRTYMTLLSKVIQTLQDRGYDAAVEMLNAINNDFPAQKNLETVSKNRLKMALGQLDRDFVAYKRKTGIK